MNLYNTRVDPKETCIIMIVLSQHWLGDKTRNSGHSLLIYKRCIL
jgi:hypothetical protein